MLAYSRLVTLLAMRRLVENEARQAVMWTRRELAQIEGQVTEAIERLHESRARLAAAEKEVAQRELAGGKAGRQALWGSLIAARREEVEAARRVQQDYERKFTIALRSAEEARAGLEKALRAREAAQAEEARRKEAARRRGMRREQLAVEDARLGKGT